MNKPDYEELFREALEALEDIARDEDYNEQGLRNMADSKRSYLRNRELEMTMDEMKP